MILSCKLWPIVLTPKVFVATCKPTLFTFTQIHKCCAFQECIENINQCRHNFKMWMLENLNSRASFSKMAGELKIVLLKGSRRVLRRVSSMRSLGAVLKRSALEFIHPFLISCSRSVGLHGLNWKCLIPIFCYVRPNKKINMFIVPALLLFWRFFIFLFIL